MCELANEKVAQGGFTEDTYVSSHNYQLLNLFTSQTHFNRRKISTSGSFLRFGNGALLFLSVQYSGSEIDENPGRTGDNLEVPGKEGIVHYSYFACSLLSTQYI